MLRKTTTMQNQIPETKIKVELSTSELKLIEYIRKLKWGSVEITVQNSLPVIIKQAIQTIKLM